MLMVSTTSHIFINLFQMVFSSTVKFTRRNKKNMRFFSDTKILQLYQNLRHLKKKEKTEAIIYWASLIVVDQVAGCAIILLTDRKKWVLNTYQTSCNMVFKLICHPIKRNE